MCSSPKPDPQATRATLLERVRHLSDHKSWQEFYSIYHPLIYSVAIKSGLHPQEAEDVVQETMVRMTRKLPEFSYDPGLGSFRAWLRVTTRWCIVQQYRRRLPQATTEWDEASEMAAAGAEEAVDPAFEATWKAEESVTLLKLATERAKARASDQQFQIYDCLVNKGWSVSKTASLLGVTSATIYLAKCRFLKLLKKELARISQAERTQR